MMKIIITYLICFILNNCVTQTQSSEAVNDITCRINPELKNNSAGISATFPVQKNISYCLEAQAKPIILHNDDTKINSLNTSTISDIGSADSNNSASNNSEILNQSNQVVHIYEDKQPSIKECNDIECKQTPGSGRLHYRKWRERNEVNLLVNGDNINGTPIFVEQDTLRVINDDYSYFIPLEKIDYIRTNDGLKSSFRLAENK